MPLVLHLRWNDLDDDQAHRLRRLLERQRDHPGCSSCTPLADGTALLATMVWEDQGSLLAFSLGPLAELAADAGLAPPQTAVFSVPALFAAGHRRPPAVPAPRPASDVEPLATAPAGGQRRASAGRA